LIDSVPQFSALRKLKITEGIGMTKYRLPRTYGCLILSGFLASFSTQGASADAASAAKALRDELSIPQLQAAMNSARFSSRELTQAALARINAIDDNPNGPKLNAVLTLNPQALEAAREADRQRASGNKSPMLGIPILVKDNIDTNDDMATTAGSLALKDNFTRRDNPAVARLRAAGAVILGKTNLSEWANIRGDGSISGWSALGGFTKNPYGQTRTPCGSSSGTGSAISASMAVIGIGTETDGSIVCPANMNGLVGFKPTVGLVSRSHVIPISHTQDTLGPMGRNVEDVAIMLAVMAGSDPLDRATIAADAQKVDYFAALEGATLAGRRLGILRDMVGPQPKTQAVFEQNLKKLQAAGAVLIEIPTSRISGAGAAELVVLMHELKASLNAYLTTTPNSVTTRTLEQIIAFNRANAATEMPYFGQDLFEKAQATNGLDAPEYVHALTRSRDLAAASLNSLFSAYNVDALISPTAGPAWMIDEINGDVSDGASASGLPAMAGLPHLTVPMGQIQGLPIGLSFIGRQWDEAKILGLGYAFEKLKRERVAPLP